MLDHDQFLKQLLQACFGDLVQIVAPEIASKLQLDRPTFLESETFTDAPEGEHRRLDLVARVESLRGGPEFILIHVEVEAQARSTMGRRLFEYAMQLWLRHRRPIVPIVVYLRGGKADVMRETETIGVFGEPLMSLRYHAFGLSQSDAAAYLTRPEPLAWALAAVMRHDKVSAAEHRLTCLRPVARARIDEARRFLLANFIATYVELDESEQEEYETLLRDEQNREVAVMAELTLTTNADRLVQKGFTEGRALGEREGRERGQQELLLHLLTRRFGPLPVSARKSVRSLSPEELSHLAEQILDAKSLDDLGL